MRPRSAASRPWRFVVAVAWALALSGCGGSNGDAEPVAVSATKDQIALWNAFVAKAKAEGWHPVMFYTRKENPVKSLEEITAKDQFAVCSLNGHYIDLVLELFGYGKENVAGLTVCGGRPSTLAETKMRMYLAYEAWEEELRSYGWVPVQFVP